MEGRARRGSDGRRRAAPIVGEHGGQWHGIFIGVLLLTDRAPCKTRGHGCLMRVGSWGALSSSKASFS